MSLNVKVVFINEKQVPIHSCSIVKLFLFVPILLFVAIHFKCVLLDLTNKVAYRSKMSAKYILCMFYVKKDLVESIFVFFFSIFNE
jgi:hypothetical protein